MGGLGVEVQHFPLTLLVVLTTLTLPFERDYPVCEATLYDVCVYRWRLLCSTSRLDTVSQHCVMTSSRNQTTCCLTHKYDGLNWHYQTLQLPCSLVNTQRVCTVATSYGLSIFCPLSLSVKFQLQFCADKLLRIIRNRPQTDIAVRRDANARNEQQYSLCRPTRRRDSRTFYRAAHCIMILQFCQSVRHTNLVSKRLN